MDEGAGFGGRSWPSDPSLLGRAWWMKTFPPVVAAAKAGVFPSTKQQLMIIISSTLGYDDQSLGYRMLERKVEGVYQHVINYI
jgi:hypothetical protein